MSKISSADQKARLIAATRQFRNANGDEIVATIFVPVPLSTDEWKCEFCIVNPTAEIVGHARGVDSLQAMTLAIEGLRLQLEHVHTTGGGLAWEEGELGDLGIPRSIPQGYGPAVEERLVRLLKDEITRLVETKRRSVTGSE